MFIPLAIGVMMSAICAPFVNKHYLKICAQYNGTPPPEKRLIPMMVSCWFVPMGLFIFAWTSYRDLHWIGPAIGGFPVGFGFIFLYNSCNNYLGKWNSCFPIADGQLNWLCDSQWIPINIKQLPLWLQRRFCVRCGELPLFSLPTRCITAWATSGPLRSWHSLRWLAAPSHFSFTTRAKRFEATPNLRMLVMKKSRRRRRSSERPPVFLNFGQPRTRVKSSLMIPGIL